MTNDVDSVPSPAAWSWTAFESFAGLIEQPEWRNATAKRVMFLAETLDVADAILKKSIIEAAKPYAAHTLTTSGAPQIGKLPFVAAILAPNSLSAENRLADALMFVVILAMQPGIYRKGLINVADGARKSRSESRWHQALQRLPKPELSFEEWLLKLAQVQAALLLEGGGSLPTKEIEQFTDALRAAASGLTHTKRQRNADPLKKIDRHSPKTVDQSSTDAAREQDQNRERKQTLASTQRRTVVSSSSSAARASASWARRKPNDDVPVPSHDVIESRPDAELPEEVPPPIIVLTTSDKTQPSEDGRPALLPDSPWLKEVAPAALASKLEAKQPADVAPSLHSEHARARSAGYRITQLGNRLRWDWDHLNPYDLRALRDAFFREMTAGSKSPGALAVAVMLSTGSRVAELRDAPAPVKTHFRKVLHGPPNRWKGAGAEGLLLPCRGEIDLPWPKFVIGLAAAWQDPARHVATLGEMLDLSPTKLTAEVQSWLEALRATDPSVRLTRGRVARQLALEIRGLTGAEWSVYMLSGKENDVAPVSTYYTAVGSSTLESAYVEADLKDRGTSSLAAETREGARIARDSAISEWIAGLRTSAAKPWDTSGSLAEAHNSYANYVLWLLMAATGHRPVLDPFESLDCIDRKGRWLLISDKAWQQGDQARIVPFHDLVSAAIDGWIEHLRRLADLVPDAELALRIRSTISTDGVRSLPLFFLLKDDGTTTWETRISADELHSTLGTLKALQPNFWRRQLSSHFATLGVADELARAYLGHEETSASPFGRFSTRSAEQLRELADAVDRWLMALGWTVIGSPLPRVKSPSEQESPRTTFTPPVKAQLLGTEERQRVRDQNERRLIGSAKSELAKWLWVLRKSPAQATVDQLFEALDRMGSPSSPSLIELRARARDIVLTIAARNEQVGLSVPASGRVFKHEPAAFVVDDLRRVAGLAALRDAFQEVLQAKARRGAKAEDRTALAEGLVSLVIHSLVADRQSLLGLWRDGGGQLWQLPGCAAQLCLEHAVTGRHAEAIIRRYPLHPCTAALLARAGNNVAPLDGRSRSSRALVELVSTMRTVAGLTRTSIPNSDAAAIQLLCEFATPATRLTFPADCAAYLDGRSRSVGLPTPDWLHVLGRPSERGTAADPSSGSVEKKAPTTNPLASPDRSSFEAAQARQAAQALHLAVVGAFSAAKASDEKVSGSKGRESSRTKRDAAAALSKALDDHTEAPVLLRGLVQWTVDLIGGKLRLASCKRYYYALALLIRDHGSDVTLENYTADALTDAYAEMMDATPSSNVDMALGRLYEFHDFLMQQHAVPDVDWSDVIPEHAADAQAPDAALVTAAAYRQALQLLANDPDASVRDRTLQCTLLVLLYRFGLRSGEAAAMARSDLLYVEGAACPWIVLVRANQHRAIKSDAGVRQVPLLEHIDDQEARLLADWRLHAEEQGRTDRLSALFSDLGVSRGLQDVQRARNRIVQALAITTGNARFRLHHLRHSYASRICMLLGLQSLPEGTLGELIRRLVGNTPPEHVQQQLLDRPGMDGRALWALATIMGHRSPATTMRWYVHLVETRAAKLAVQASEVFPVRLTRYEFRYWTGVDSPDRQATVRIDQSTLRLVQNVQMLSFQRGRPLEAALPPRSSSANSPIDLAVVDRVLDCAYRSGRADAIAATVQRDLAEVMPVLEADFKVRRRSGYDLPGAMWALTEPNVRFAPGRAGSRRLRETVRLAPALDLASEAVLKDLERATRISHLWLSLYKASSTPLLLRSVDEVEVFKSWLHDLGVSYILTSLSPLAAQTENSNADVARSDQRIATWLGHVQGPTHAARLPLYGLQIERNRDGLLATTAALHRLLHVLSVYIVLKQR